MTPFLVNSWDIDAAGTRVSLTLRKGLKWQSPIGYEDQDFGELNAVELVEWFNRHNTTTNPESTYAEGGDLAAVLLEAKAVDEYTVEIGLVSPVFHCLPLSQFGCLSTTRGVHKVTSADTEGVEWARAHHIGTGPYVQGQCTPGDRCTMHAVDRHWRKIGNVAHIVGIEVPESTTQIAMLKNGAIDMAELDYKLLPDVLADGFTFLETMPGGFVGQSVLFPGNLWEHSHAVTAEPLEPWNNPSYEKDYPWIGNPWGHQGGTCANGDSPGHVLCGNAPYTDIDNPAGMDDMEQARLVRLALSTAIDRGAVNDSLLNGIGTPIYSEYMGPNYPGWDSSRNAGCFSWTGDAVSCSGTVQSVPWQIADGDLDAAGALLDSAGYPLVGGKRQGFEKLTLQAYSAEAGPAGLEVADTIMSDWARLGIEIEGLVEDYGGVISPRMRQRIQFLPVLMNGDIHSNVYPLDWPLPRIDTSASRPHWGVGFESQAGSRWLFEILGEQNPNVRSEKHLNWVDYSIFWQQYAGVFQVPKGIVVNDRIESWDGYQQHYSNVSSNPEFIELVGGARNDSGSSGGPGSSGPVTPWVSPTPWPTSTPGPTPAPTATPRPWKSVTGVLSGTTTWDNTTVNLDGPVLVPSGAVLRIIEGSSVNLNGHPLRIEGSIVANGTDSNPIVITNFSSNYDNSIVVAPGSINSSFRFVNFNNLAHSSSLAIENASVSIADSTFGNSQGYGVLLNSNVPVTIERSTFEGRNNRGLFIGGSAQAVVTDSVFSGMGAQAVYLNGGSQSTLSRNVFKSNGFDSDDWGSAITAESSAVFTIVNNQFENNRNSIILVNPAISSVNIRNNNFISSTRYAIKVYSSNESSNSMQIQAPSNYWGSRGMPNPENVILDNDDDFRLVQIVPSSPLSSAANISQAPLPTAVPNGTISIELGTTPEGVVGQAISLVSTRVISEGTPGALVAEIDWGDGSGAKPAIVIQETGIIVGSHVYTSSGSGGFDATITVRSEFGGTATAEIRVIVSPI
ncbi:hypothetical protein GKO46_05740 [SAR202 cluster bacterium JH702]|uniref:Periplasmic copper-binding protein NosD beta helix domain-containing protein n=1 Tax=Candidatus Lucifugimonas marina TaxID=3038979 RepID=A0ABD4XPN5_9CHLR|nr:hypothetical protein [SAR202 cluster bacterium JH702]